MTKQTREEQRFNLISKSLKRRFKLQRPGYKMTDPTFNAEWRAFLYDVTRNGRNDDEFVMVAKRLLLELDKEERNTLHFAMVIKPAKKKKKRTKITKASPRAEQFRTIRIYDQVCRYCMIGPASTVDHIIPQSRGGSHQAINLVGCCGPCNQRKEDMTPREAGMVVHLPLRFFLPGAMPPIQ